MATHEVYVLCSCDDIEHCRLEVYVSDVRLAIARIAQLEQDHAAYPDSV